MDIILEVFGQTLAGERVSGSASFRSISATTAAAVSSSRLPAACRIRVGVTRS